MSRLLMPLVALLLASCGTTQMTRPDPVPPVDIRRSTVAVHVPCAAKEKLGPEPEYEDSDERLRDIPFPMAMTQNEWEANWFYQTKQLVAGRKQHIKRDQEKDAILKDC